VQSSREVWHERDCARPFVILTQPTCCDATRALAGHHVAWAYAHVPWNSPRDVTAAIEAQVERFAPGFGETVLARMTRTAPQFEADNPNLVGGAITGGTQDLRQVLARPVLSRDPYRTPLRFLFLCSAATPPGGGVHGMCGWHAARSAARSLGLTLPFVPRA
jgi:phytoene dehydrogenase-like protein